MYLQVDMVLYRWIFGNSHHLLEDNMEDPPANNLDRMREERTAQRKAATKEVQPKAAEEVQRKAAEEAQRKAAKDKEGEAAIDEDGNESNLTQLVDEDPSADANPRATPYWDQPMDQDDWAVIEAANKCIDEREREVETRRADKSKKQPRDIATDEDDKSEDEELTPARIPTWGRGQGRGHARGHAHVGEEREVCVEYVLCLFYTTARSTSYL